MIYPATQRRRHQDNHVAVSGAMLWRNGIVSQSKVPCAPINMRTFFASTVENRCVLGRDRHCLVTGHFWNRCGVLCAEQRPLIPEFLGINSLGADSLMQLVNVNRIFKGRP